MLQFVTDDSILRDGDCLEGMQKFIVYLSFFIDVQYFSVLSIRFYRPRK